MGMMAGKAFLDTNIVLRAFHDTFPDSEAVRRLVDVVLDQGYELWISRQVLREYLVQATHPATFAVPLSGDAVAKHIEAILAICNVADETNAVTTQLLDFVERGRVRGKQIHDANIVATMLVYELDTLLTLNVADVKRYADSIRIMTPADSPTR